MKVLLINGSPHKDGCTFTALNEVAKTLEKKTELLCQNENLIFGQIL